MAELFNKLLTIYLGAFVVISVIGIIWGLLLIPYELCKIRKLEGELEKQRQQKHTTGE